jgi:3D (Asp-Asp-Asp) domain-containing protein
VGRFNNTADDVTQPLEIKHQNSGERITLDSSGLKTQKMDDDRLYAGAFPGSDPDTRLSNALSSSSDGDTILLESSAYNQNQTISKRVTLIGTTLSNGTDIQNGVTWNITGFDVSIIRLRLRGEIVYSSNGNIRDIQMIGGAITVDSSEADISHVRAGNITLTSNSSKCIVDSSVGVSIADNGSNNIIGDIS